MYVENIGKYSNEKMNKEVCRGIRVFQKKIKLLLYYNLGNFPI